MRGRYIITLCLVAIVSVSDFYVPSFWLSEAGGMRFSFIEKK